MALFNWLRKDKTKPTSDQAESDQIDAPHVVRSEARNLSEPDTVPHDDPPAAPAVIPSEARNLSEDNSVAHDDSPAPAPAPPVEPPRQVEIAVSRLNELLMSFHDAASRQTLKNLADRIRKHHDRRVDVADLCAQIIRKIDDFEGGRIAAIQAGTLPRTVREWFLMLADLGAVKLL